LGKTVARVPSTLLIGALLGLAGCAVALAPAYDASISQALSAANLDIQTLFVGIGPDADASTFAVRKPAYDHIIAELRAVQVQITARPTPDPALLAKADTFLAHEKIGRVTVDPNFSAYPSARAVGDLADVIQHMESADQTAGLHREAVPAFEQQATILLTQAIIYENFLRR
jgi:hypothetical protein